MADVLGSDMEAVAIETLDNLWLATFVRNHPFLDRLKIKKAGGSGYRIPVQTGPGGGASSSFGNSLTNSASNGFTGVGFSVPPAAQYGTTRIQWQEQALSDTPQSPVEIASNASKNAMELATENLANMLLGSSSGAAGSYAVISANSNVSTVYTLTLTVPTDASKFNIGQVIVSKATASAALDTGSATVLGVNAIAGRIVVDAGASGWTATNTHIVGLEGQLPTGSDTSGLFPSVMQWVPPVANRSNGVPTTTTFLGVPRDSSSNVVAVSGWAWDGSSTPPFQALYAASAYMQNNSKLAKPNVCYVNPLLLPKMAQMADSKMRYDMESVNGVDVGFAGFTAVLPTGKCDILGEPSMPVTAMLLSKQESWELAIPGGGRILGPATNGKMIIDDFGSDTGLNQSRCTVMAGPGFFGCNELSANAIITVGVGTGLNL